MNFRSRLLVVFLSILPAPGARAESVLLEPPSPAYPTLLDHSCGGVHTDTFVLGFDANGNVLGAVHAWTRCGIGSGRFRRSRNFSSWHKLVWDLHGKLLSTSATPALQPDPDFTASDAHGNTISTRRPGPDSSPGHYVGILTTP
jgi:hypothetical protein